jgi:hypothetical protein
MAGPWSAGGRVNLSVRHANCPCAKPDCSEVWRTLFIVTDIHPRFIDKLSGRRCVLADPNVFQGNDIQTNRICAPKSLLATD